MKIRCAWSNNNDIYIKYHDKEWGVPVTDDDKLFEFLLLESFQAGLSWITILKKRENFRKAFDNFNYNKIANYDSKKYDILLKDEGIIRNRLKIKAAIANAKHFIEIQQKHGSFSNYIWSFVNNKPITNSFKSLSSVPSSTPLSDKISKDLKNKGFKFVGTTIIYAFMQATGLVNDHVTDCFRYNEIKKCS